MRKLGVACVIAVLASAMAGAVLPKGAGGARAPVDAVIFPSGGGHMDALQRGEAEAALVYRSTVRASDKARVAAVAPPETHDAIFFEGAVVKATRHADEAQLFLQYLLSPAAARVLEEHGFRAAK